MIGNPNNPTRERFAQAQREVETINAQREQRSSTDRRNAPRATDAHRRAADRIERADLDSLSTLRSVFQGYCEARSETTNANHHSRSDN